LRMINVVTFVSAGLTGVLFLIARPLILLLLTEKWLGAVPIFELLCWSGLFYPISAAQLSIIKAKGQSRLFLRLEVVKKLVYFSVIAVGFSFGMRGFLVSLIVSAMINTTINIFFTGRALGVSMGGQLRGTLAPIMSMGLGVIVAKGAMGMLALHSLVMGATVAPALFVVIFLGLTRVASPEIIATVKGAVLGIVGSRRV